METKKQTESVLAKLMGLERPLTGNQIRYSRQRALSESYIQDIALISQHQKWSFDRYSVDNDYRMLDRRDSSEDLQSSSSSDEFFDRYRVGEDRLFQKLCLLNSFQKDEKVKSTKKIECVSQSTVRSVSRNEKVGNMNYVQLLSSNARKRERDCLRGRDALRDTSKATNRIAKQVANELQNSVFHEYLSAVGSVSNRNENSFAANMNTSHSDRRNGEGVWNSTPLPSSGSSKSRNKNFSVHKDWCLNLMNEGSSYCNSLQEVNCKSEEDLTSGNSTSFTSHHSEKDVSCEETRFTTSDLNEFGKRDLLKEIPTVPLSPKEISTCSDVETISSNNMEGVDVDTISQQVVNDASMPLHQPDNEFPPYHMEANKQNPDAPSNMKDISSTAHVSAIHGPEVNLEQSTETIFTPEAKRRKKIDAKESEEGEFKTQETQALVYLVDVLAESGIGQSLENLINPFVFDSLEKKYSKQPSWLKSDRKLLFDRIKCALSDILNPNTGINTWRRYKANSLLFHCNEDIIKQEVLSMLVKEEKDANRVPSEKAVGIDCDWLELGEDMQIIVKEIEESLIDELVEEIVSSELLI